MSGKGSYEQSSSSGKQGSQSYTAEQNEWLKKVLSTYGPTVGQGQQVYQGPRTADFSPQQKALTNVEGYQDAFNANRAMPLFGETGTAIADAMSGKSGAQPLSMQQAGQTFQDTRVNPAMENFQRYTTPGITEQFAGPGYWGAARGQALSQAGTDVAKGLNTDRSSFLWDVENANRQITQQNADRQLQATNQGMQYGQLPTQEAQARLTGQTGAFNLASAEQQQRQAIIDEEMTKFAEANRITDPESLQVLMTALGMNYTFSWGKQSSSGLGIGGGVQFTPVSADSGS